MIPYIDNSEDSKFELLSKLNCIVYNQGDGNPSTSAGSFQEPEIFKELNPLESCLIYKGFFVIIQSTNDLLYESTAHSYKDQFTEDSIIVKSLHGDGKLISQFLKTLPRDIYVGQFVGGTVLASPITSVKPDNSELGSFAINVTSTTEGGVHVNFKLSDKSLEILSRDMKKLQTFSHDKYTRERDETNHDFSLDFID